MGPPRGVFCQITLTSCSLSLTLGDGHLHSPQSDSATALAEFALSECSCMVMCNWLKRYTHQVFSSPMRGGATRSLQSTAMAMYCAATCLTDVGELMRQYVVRCGSCRCQWAELCRLDIGPICLARQQRRPLSFLFINPLMGTGSCSATSNNMKLVHWPLWVGCYIWYSYRGLGGAAARPGPSSL